MYKKSVITLSILAIFSLVVALSGCSTHKVVKRYSGAEAEQYLRGRLWLDRYPEDRKDPFLVYFFDTRSNLGVHIRAFSVYKRIYEYYNYRADSEKLQFQFLHDDRKAETRYTIEQIKPVGEFNLKLTLQSDPQEKGKRSEYFSNTTWSGTQGVFESEELINMQKSGPGR